MKEHSRLTPKGRLRKYRPKVPMSVPRACANNRFKVIFEYFFDRIAVSKDQTTVTPNSQFSRLSNQYQAARAIYCNFGTVAPSYPGGPSNEMQLCVHMAVKLHQAVVPHPLLVPDTSRSQSSGIYVRGGWYGSQPEEWEPNRKKINQITTEKEQITMKSQQLMKQPKLQPRLIVIPHIYKLGPNQIGPQISSGVIPSMSWP